METNSYASVRSTSTTSSGFLLVSQKKNILKPGLYEPPPDYDSEGEKEGEQMEERKVQYSCKEIVRKEEVVPLNQPLLIENRETQGSPQQGPPEPKQTIVRINSASQNLHIEVVDNTQSPASTTGDSAFLYEGRNKQTNTSSQSKRKCCCQPKTNMEKCLCVVLIVGVSVIVAVVLTLYFSGQLDS